MQYMALYTFTFSLHALLLMDMYKQVHQCSGKVYTASFAKCVERHDVSTAYLLRFIVVPFHLIARVIRTNNEGQIRF